jgi:hypothetical protein
MTEPKFTGLAVQRFLEDGIRTGGAGVRDHVLWRDLQC